MVERSIKQFEEYHGSLTSARISRLGYWASLINLHPVPLCAHDVAPRRDGSEPNRRTGIDAAYWNGLAQQAAADACGRGGGSVLVLRP